MYFGPKEHNPPHIHTFYAENEATFDINTSEMIDGVMPARQVRLITAWIEIHREDLIANWKLCQSGEKPFPIDPLQ